MPPRRLKGLAAAVLAGAVLPSHAALNATLYDGWARGGVAQGWSGDITFDGLPVLASFVDPNIDHWDDDDQRWNPLGHDELYSVRWTGFIDIETAGLHPFRVYADDGVQVFIGGQRVVDHPDLNWYRPLDAAVELPAGRLPIEVRFYEHTIHDGIELQWRPPGATDFSIVPASVLSVPEPPPAALLALGLPLLAGWRRLARRR